MLHRARRVGAEKIDSIDDQHNRAYHLEPALVRFYELSDKRESEASKETIDEVAQTCSDPGEEGGPAAAIKSALDT